MFSTCWNGGCHAICISSISSNVLFFGKQDNLGQFNIGDNNILPEDNVKILGLNVDNKLNCNTQITNICQTARIIVQVLKRFLMYSTSPVSYYYIIALLNVILTIELVYLPEGKYLLGISPNGLQTGHCDAPGIMSAVS